MMLMGHHLPDPGLEDDQYLNYARCVILVNVGLRGQKKQTVPFFERINPVVDSATQSSFQDIDKFFTGVGDLAAGAAFARFNAHQERLNLLMWKTTSQVFHHDSVCRGRRVVPSFQMNGVFLTELFKKGSDRNTERTGQVV